MPEPTSPCVFDGIVAGVSLRGEGHAVLVEPAALAGNARVRLHGASISNTGPTVEIVDHREMFAPVGVNPCDSPYEVDYTHGGGGNVVIDIVRGGDTGGFQGRLAGAPECATRSCEVVWSPGVKRIDLRRDAAQPYALTGAFPFGAPAICGDSGIKTRGAVLEVKLHGAADKLKCGEREERLEGDWTWRPGPVQDLGVSEIRVEQAGLQVRVESTAHPERAEVTVPAGVTPSAPPAPSARAPALPSGQEAPSWLPAYVAVPATALLVLAAILVSLLLRRRRASSRVAAPETPAADASSGRLAPGRLRALADALIEAFPDEARLSRMLRFGLDKNLAEIAGSGPLRDVVFHLLETAEAEGWTRRLVAAARESNPGNPKLAEIARAIDTSTSQPEQDFLR